MGPACQYGNLAYNRAAQGNLGNNAIVIDSDRTTCSLNTHNSPYVSIDLEKSFTVNRLILYNKIYESDPVTGLSIHISSTENDYSTDTVCISDDGASVTKEVLEVKCRDTLMGRYVIVRITGSNIHMPVCEIQIYGGVNGAYGKPTELSSTWSQTYPSWQAVDGSYIRASSAVHTALGDNNPYWWVNIQKEITIHRIRLYYASGVEFRLNGFTLEIIKQQTSVFNTIIAGWSPYVDISVDRNISGDMVKISRYGTDKWLQMVEVEVYYYCAPRSFGLQCEKTCNCYARTEVCDYIHGSCISGCSLGYHGTDCLTECPDGTFGWQCNSTCNCQDQSDVCIKVNGNCTDGCKKGFEGDGCLQACPDKTFGSECKHNCNCYNIDEVCNKTNGHCISGCKSGYTGDDCLKVCPDETFGSNCVHACNCYNRNEVCNKTDGQCTSGCKSGYKGSDCMQVCPDETFGSNCVHACNCYNTNEVCNKTDGQCTSGCKSGYKGIDCMKEIVQPPDDDKTVSIVGGVVGVLCVLIGIVAVVAVIFCRRRKRQKKTQSEFLPSRTDAVYENIVELETTRNGSPKPPPAKGHRVSSTRLASNVQDAPIYEPTEDVDEEGPTPALRGVGQYYKMDVSSGNTTTVSVDDLWNYVSNKNQDAFEAEFKKVPANMVKPYEAAKANMWKNRYRALYAYDHTRVKLSPPNEDGCDYMNANYIEGYRRSREFIASQGTTEHNIGDFWLMIWQQKCTGIVMLTNLIEEAREKCLQYWPKEGVASEMFGPVQVTLQSEEVFCNFTIRILCASKDGQSRIVTQYHFTAWPDKGVPAYPSSLVQFHHKVRRRYSDNKNPLVVHCSAGVGRTGTFICLDYLVNQAKQEGKVDAFECLKKVREQRVNMIQTLDQYVFLHTALVEALHCKGNYMSCDDFRKLYQDINSDEGMKVLEDNFQKLENIYSGYNVTFTAGKKAENLVKNRNQDILPADSERPLLSPNLPGCDDYINAVFLPGLRKRRQFIVTQTPLESTVIDFWRMINQHDTKVIVDLGSDPVDYQVFPGNSEMTIGPFTVTNVKQEHDADIDCVVQTLIVRYKTTFKVLRLIPQFWGGRCKTPKSVPKMIKFIYEVEKHGQYGQNGGIVVTCPDGATRCGLFCAAFVSLDRLRVEQEIGTGQIIEQYRSIRPQVFPNKEQLKYCYDILMLCLSENETYSNFA